MASLAWIAPETQAAGSQVVIIGSDRGGLLGPRVEQIAALRASGGRVEIRGPDCLSSCTMYLGAGDVCVAPGVRFGFHGPSWYGTPLREVEFEYWSEVMAGHYPDRLRSWFMEEGRFLIVGYHEVPATEIIAMGVPQC
ncbi:hypothetical protein [Roseivivax sp. CAU 1761]